MNPQQCFLALNSRFWVKRPRSKSHFTAAKNHVYHILNLQKSCGEFSALPRRIRKNAGDHLDVSGGNLNEPPLNARKTDSGPTAFPPCVFMGTTCAGDPMCVFLHLWCFKKGPDNVMPKSLLLLPLLVNASRGFKYLTIFP